jgi:outer membrane lipase/esterase
MPIPFHPRLRVASLLVAAALGLAACGGGEQVSEFRATRVLAFGDEASVIVDTAGNANGRKYTVNATVSATDPTLDCRANPIWIQAVGNRFGLPFPQCNYGTTAVASPVNRIRAAAGARSADVAAQVDAQLAESAIGKGDLATVLVGLNDIVAAYRTYPTRSEAEISATVRDAGIAAALQVNRLANLDARVIVATVVDAGVTPFGRSERAANTDTDRSALLTRLTASFNSGLRGALVNDGRRIGLVLLDEYISVTAKFTGLNGIANSADTACNLTLSTQVPPSALDCTTSTLVSGASATSWLWADTLRLSPAGQTALGTFANERLDNNPF